MNEMDKKKILWCKHAFCPSLVSSFLWYRFYFHLRDVDSSSFWRNLFVMYWEWCVLPPWWRCRLLTLRCINLTNARGARTHTHTHKSKPWNERRLVFSPPQITQRTRKERRKGRRRIQRTGVRRLPHNVIWWQRCEKRNRYIHSSQRKANEEAGEEKKKYCWKEYHQIVALCFFGADILMSGRLLYHRHFTEWKGAPVPFVFEWICKGIVKDCEMYLLPSVRCILWQMGRRDSTEW